MEQSTRLKLGSPVLVNESLSSPFIFSSNNIFFVPPLTLCLSLHRQLSRSSANRSHSTKARSSWIPTAKSKTHRLLRSPPVCNSPPIRFPHIWTPDPLTDHCHIQRTRSTRSLRCSRASPKRRRARRARIPRAAKATRPPQPTASSTPPR